MSGAGLPTSIFDSGGSSRARAAGMHNSSAASPRCHRLMVRSPCWGLALFVALSARVLGLLDQLLDGRVEDLVAGAAHPLVADHALGVEEVQRRPTFQAPLL